MRYAGTIIFWLCKKCIWIFLTLAALSNARCSTTTQAALGAPATNAWITEHESLLVARARGAPVNLHLVVEEAGGDLQSGLERRMFDRLNG